MGDIFSEAITQPLVVHTVVKVICFLLSNNIWQLNDCISSEIVVSS